MSSQEAEKSSKLSKDVTKICVETVAKAAPNTNFDISNHIVRKNAHFFAYLILGMLVMNALRRSEVVRYKSIALLICVFYDISDQVHQMFVPGRGLRLEMYLLIILGNVLGFWCI